MLNRLTIFVSGNIVVISLLFLFAIVIQQPSQHYNVYAQIPGISSLSGNNNTINNSNTDTETTTTNKTTSNNDLLTYENSDFGFKVQYPLNWIRYETIISGEFSDTILKSLKEGGSGRPVVDFCPSNNNSAQNNNQATTTASTYVSPCFLHKNAISIMVYDELKPSDNPLQTFTEQIISKHTSYNNLIVKSEPTTLSGLPAHRITYTAKIFSNLPPENRIEMWTINNDKAYDIIYFPVGQRADLSPEAQKIIDSFQIIK